MRILDEILKTKKFVVGVAYARFSSDMQRDESIEAQLRAIEEYAARNNIIVKERYIDKAKSATTDRRPEVQRMIEDSKSREFDVVLVHKLDRFARNRYDSIGYRTELKRNGVTLISVLEYIDDSPESIILESVLEAMAEYYSKNLAREVEKGKVENALKAKHIGGKPPLGYRLDRDTMTLVIEPAEAEAVKFIFENTLNGMGYSQICNELNKRGYRTKFGNPFGKNSLFSILQNPKYCGTYTYNRSAAKSVDGKRNGHKHKPESDIIQIEDAIPAIISPADFDKVQKKMKERAHRNGRYKAKHTYLLSGKIICGICGSAFSGNSRKPRPDHPSYISYKCVKKNGQVKCHNHEIRREALEHYVLNKLAELVFSDKLIDHVCSSYANYQIQMQSDLLHRVQNLEKAHKEIDMEIENVVNVIAKTGSTALADRLSSLERTKENIIEQEEEITMAFHSGEYHRENVTKLFLKARQLFREGKLETQQALIELFVNRIIIFEDHVEIIFNFSENESNFADKITDKIKSDPEFRKKISQSSALKDKNSAIFREFLALRGDSAGGEVRHKISLH